MEAILRNRAKCKLCGDIIESLWRNDFRTCSCGNLHVDGGLDYIRRGFREGKDSFENLNEYGLDIMPFFSTGPGWWKMLDKELKDMYDADPVLTDVGVKEKYGRARVEYGECSANRRDLVLMHEEIIDRVSGETCELCGAYGSIRNDHGWLQCHCDRCHGASHEERAKIMRQTAAEYEATVYQTLNSVAGSMALSGMELTDRDKAYIRYAIWFPDEIEKTLSEIISRHSRGGREE